MPITSFQQADFDVFSIPSLAPRMDAIKERIQPKFAELGPEIADFLTDLLNEPMYIHIAKHARRTVHPPEKTWIAWAANNRGYKPYPHFQLGIDHQSLSLWFAIFSECKRKKEAARNLQEQLTEWWQTLPKHFLFSEDHTQAEHVRLTELKQEGLAEKLERLHKVKKAEFLCGIQIPKSESVVQSSEQLRKQIRDTFQELKSLYKISIY